MVTPAPLVCGIVNNALLHSSPTINHTLPQFVHILHFFWEILVDSLLHYAPDFMNYYSNISQGSGATHLRCGGIFNDHFITNFLLRLMV